MNRILTSIIGLLILSGCTTIRFQTLDVKNAAAIKDQTVAVTNYPKPDFSAMTPAKATLAIVGAFAAISEGNQIIANNNVADPAKKTSDELVAALENKLGAKRIATPIEVTDDDVSKIATLAAPTARYVIDVKSFVWNMGYFATDWFHYRVIYTARARLIDTNAKTVIAEGFCKRIPDSNANAPTYDEVLANQAKWLKEEVNQVALTCADSFKKEMLAFAIPTSPIAEAQATAKALTERVTTNSQPEPIPPQKVVLTKTETVANAITPSPTSGSTESIKPDLTPAPTSAILTPQAQSQQMTQTAPVPNKVPAPVSTAGTKLEPPSPEPSKQSNIYQPTVREIVQTPPEKGSIQLVEFVLGVSSATVERLAKNQSCFGGNGAGLVSPKGSRELYKMKCDDGKILMAKCELRQCSVLSHH